MAFKEPPQTDQAFSENGYTCDKPKDFPILPEDGSWRQFHRSGWARRLPDGSEEIVTKFGSTATKDRQGFEKPFSRALGEPGYEMAHSQGLITGVESPYGFGLVRKEVNQEFQRLGIEKQIAEIQHDKPENVDLYLKTIAKNDGNYLKSIDYQVEGVDRDSKRSFTLFTANISIDQERSSGTITITQVDPKDHNIHSEHKQEFCRSFNLDGIDEPKSKLGQKLQKEHQQKDVHQTKDSFGMEK